MEKDGTIMEKLTHWELLLHMFLSLGLPESFALTAGKISIDGNLLKKIG